MKRIIALTMAAMAVMTISAKDYYVAVNGKDCNNGTSEKKAFASLAKAQQMVTAGDNVYILPGTYRVSEKDMMAPNHEKGYAVVFLLDKKGTKEKPISYIGVADKNGQRPVFDFTDVRPKQRITGFLLTGSYLRVKNLETIGIQVTKDDHTHSENFRLSNASYNVLENIAAHDGMGIGFYLIRRCKENYIINCDAYNNFDTVSENGKGGNSDGFGAHVGSLDSKGNTFIGCRAWYNSDDGFDLINAQAPVTFLYCIAYKNGLANINGEDKRIADGNGIKCGGYGMGKAARVKFATAPMHIAANCISAFNRAAGFYANHHLGGLHFSHCTAYMNGGAAFSMTNRKDATEEGRVNVPGYGHVVEGCLSFGYHPTKSAKHLTNVDNEKSNIRNNSFSWNADTQKWENDTKLRNDSFESIDATKLLKPRDKDGMLTEFSFLKFKEPQSYGTDFSGYAKTVEEYRNK